MSRVTDDACATSDPGFDGLPLPPPLKVPGHNLYWLEVASANETFAHRFRESLVCVLASDKDRVYTPQTTVGNGFIIAVDKARNWALLLTAKHVLEGAAAIQSPRPLHASSALFVPPSRTAPSIDQKRLKLHWSGGADHALLKVIFATYNESTDLACCIAVPREVSIPTGERFAPQNLKLGLDVPQVGDQVWMVSMANMSMVETVPPKDGSFLHQQAVFNHDISIRHGMVTGVYPNGYNQYRWPCFTTSIPVKGGMSGGLVGVYTRERPFSICGVVCADLDPYQPKDDPTVCGTSIVGCAWPALHLRVPRDLANDQTVVGGRNPTLLELIREGQIAQPAGDLDAFTLHEEGEYSWLHRRLNCD